MYISTSPLHFLYLSTIFLYSLPVAPDFPEAEASSLYLAASSLFF